MRNALNAFLARLDTYLPGPRDLVPAVLGALVGFVPLAVMRAWVAHELAPTARLADYVAVQYGDLEFWSVTALVGALLLRVLPARAHTAGRVAFHAFCTTVLASSFIELVFLAVTGSRADVDMLLFAWHDLEAVWPVVKSEVQPLQAAGVVAGLLVGFAPLLARVRASEVGPASRVTLVALLVPLVWLESAGRPAPAKALRIAQPSFVESLYWDALDRVGDKVLAPPADQLVPLAVSRPEGAPPPPNVVLVLLESTGLDATTLGNPERDTTPNLARMAAEGLVAMNHTAVVPHTSKSVVATLCGQYPWLRTDIEEARPGSLPGRCLPEILGGLGYRTSFFQTANAAFERRAELVHRMGFDLFRSRDSVERVGFQKVNYFGWEDRAMLAPGVAWASEHRDAPFFQTWLTLTSHHDYKVPTTFKKRSYNGITGRQAAHLEAVRYVDTFLGELVDAYRAEGLLENTVFVLQGDHGEAFNQHGRSQHDLVIWEEGLRVPLVIWGPGLGGRTGTLEGPRQAIDVLPTVLELVGAKVEAGYLPGTSLLQPVDGKRAVYHSCWRSHRCLSERIGDEKVIDHYRERSPQVFDLAKDPTEKQDVARSMAKDLLATRVDRMRTWRAAVNGRYEALRAASLARAMHPADAAEPPAVATFGGAIEALGCAVDGEGEVVRGDYVWVKCRWRAREELTSAWKVALRLEGGGRTPEEKSSAPLDGLLPTFRWTPGQVVEDEVFAQVPLFARAGELKVAVGWTRYGGGHIARDDGGEWLDVGSVRVVVKSPPKLKAQLAKPPASKGASAPEPPDDVPPDDVAVDEDEGP